MSASSEPSDRFDPYYTWLGIPSEGQPADYYQLLGVRRFETNLEVLSNAADQRMSYLRTFQAGKYGPLSQKLLNEVATARLCLLNPAKKTAYDAQLQASSTSLLSGESVPGSVAEAPADVSRAAGAGPPPGPVSPPPIMPLGKMPGGLPRSRPRNVSRKNPLVLAGVGGVVVLLLAFVGVLFFSGDGSNSGESGEDEPGQVAEGVIPEESSAPPSSSVPSAFQPPTTAPVDAIPASPAADAAAGRGPSAPEVPAGPPSGVAVEPRLAAPAPEARPAAPRPSSGSEGYALRFAGKQFVELANSTEVASLGREFTAEMWARWDDAPQELMGTYLHPSRHPSRKVSGWAVRFTPSQEGRPPIFWIHFGAGGRGGGSHADAPEWRHVVLTTTANGDVAAFVDGRRAVLTHQPPSDDPSIGSLNLGAQRYSEPEKQFHGEIRAFRLSSVCRYPDAFTPPDGYQFEQDADTVALLDFSSPQAGKIADLSGNGHHGTLVGAQWVALDGRNGDDLAALPADDVAVPSEPPSPDGARPLAGPSAARDSQSAATGQQPVPEAELRQAARAEASQVLKADFEEARNPEQKGALAEKLSSLAKEIEDDAATRFVLLEDAVRLAAEAGQLTLALEILDQLADQYQVDGLARKMEVIQQAAPLIRGTDDRKLLVQRALELSEEAVSAERLESAEQAAQVALTAAARSGDARLRTASRQWREEITQLKNQWGLAQKAAERLEIEPDNPKANLVRGKFLCLHQGDWPQGLPHLARGDDQALREAAEGDLAAPDEANGQVEVADRWWNVAQEADPNEKIVLLLRAEHWYRRAEPQIGGLVKVRTTKRLEEIGKLVPAAARSGQTAAAPLGRRTIASLLDEDTSNADNAFQEGLGFVGRIRVDGKDSGLLVRHQPGSQLTHARIVEELNKAGVSGKEIELELVAMFFTPLRTRVAIEHSAGSRNCNQTLFLDSTERSRAGSGITRTTAYATVQPGPHVVRWVLNGTDLGTPSVNLTFTNSSTGQRLPIPLGFNKQMLDTLRSQRTTGQADLGP